MVCFRRGYKGMDKDAIVSDITSRLDGYARGRVARKNERERVRARAEEKSEGNRKRKAENEANKERE